MVILGNRLSLGCQHIQQQNHNYLEIYTSDHHGNSSIYCSLRAYGNY